MRTRHRKAKPTPTKALSPLEVMRLHELLVASVRLRRRLLVLGRRLAAAEPETPREILRSRIECILEDQIGPAVRDLESAQAEALGEVRD